MRQLRDALPKRRTSLSLFKALAMREGLETAVEVEGGEGGRMAASPASARTAAGAARPSAAPSRI